MPEAIAQARQRVGRAVVANMGISEIHPINTNNHQPQPSGVHNVLRTPFSLGDPVNLDEELSSLVNTVQTHTCTQNTCRQGLSHQQTKCRAGFPIKLAGYRFNETAHQIERQQDNYQDGFEFGHKNNNDSSNSSNHIHGGPLQLLRNHPNVVAYNPELLLLWRGELRYLVHYMFHFNFPLLQATSMSRWSHQSGICINISIRNVCGHSQGHSPCTSC